MQWVFPRQWKIASSRWNKYAVATMVAHGAHYSISQDYVECVKMWDGSLANCLLSNLVCPLSENLLKFSLTAASGFSDTTRILLRGGNTMTKKWNRTYLLNEVTQILIVFAIANNQSTIPSPTSLLRLNFITHPPLLEVWPCSQTF